MNQYLRETLQEQHDRWVRERRAVRSAVLLVWLAAIAAVVGLLVIG